MYSSADILRIWPWIMLAMMMTLLCYSSSSSPPSPPGMLEIDSQFTTAGIVCKTAAAYDSLSVGLLEMCLLVCVWTWCGNTEVPSVGRMNGWMEWSGLKPPQKEINMLAVEKTKTPHTMYSGQLGNHFRHCLNGSNITTQKFNTTSRLIMLA